MYTQKIAQCTTLFSFHKFSLYNHMLSLKYMFLFVYNWKSKFFLYHIASIIQIHSQKLHCISNNRLYWISSLSFEILTELVSCYCWKRFSVFLRSIIQKEKVSSMKKSIHSIFFMISFMEIIKTKYNYLLENIFSDN